MMRAAALPIALLAAGAPAQAPDNAEIRAAAEAFDQAQRGKDGAALERMLAPEFLFTRASGEVGNKGDFIAGFNRPGISFAAFEVSDRLFLRIAPDAAIVGGEGRISGSESGRPFAEHFRFSHAFVRRSGQWLVTYTQITPLPR